LAIAGETPRRLRDVRRILGRLSASLTVKLVILVGIFAALPFVLYGQFEKADRQTRELLTGSIRHRSWLIAQALTPVLEKPGSMFNPGLNDILERYTQDGTVLRLMLRPKTMGRSAGFYFVASAPFLSAQQLGPELDSLNQHGILKSLSDSCSWGAPVEFRYELPGGSHELLTSVIPIDSPSGCWVLISTHNGSEFLSTAIGRPYWQTEGVRIAAIVYLVFAMVAILVAMSMRRALRHFRGVARDILRGGVTGATFTSRNIVPELSSVASDFDQLVNDLWRTAADIRETAEDNAHAVKTPLATIRSALEPVKRAVPASDHRATRSIQLIESSLTRLTALVSAAQRLGNDTADFIQAPKISTNFTLVIMDLLQNCRDLAARRNVNMVHRLAIDVCILAPDGILDVIVENILDNAISFSSDGGTITVTLSRREGLVDLYVDDEGPGIEPDKINQVFERYVSLRPMKTKNDRGDLAIDEPPHTGLGLWIVRCHVEALGGTVQATNRPNGGLRIHITLPANGF